MPTAPFLAIRFDTSTLWDRSRRHREPHGRPSDTCLALELCPVGGPGAVAPPPNCNPLLGTGVGGHYRPHPQGGQDPECVTRPGSLAFGALNPFLRGHALARVGVLSHIRNDSSWVTLTLTPTPTQDAETQHQSKKTPELVSLAKELCECLGLVSQGSDDPVRSSERWQPVLPPLRSQPLPTFSLAHLYASLVCFGLKWYASNPATDAVSWVPSTPLSASPISMGCQCFPEPWGTGHGRLLVQNPSPVGTDWKLPVQPG